MSVPSVPRVYALPSNAVNATVDLLAAFLTTVRVLHLLLVPFLTLALVMVAAVVLSPLVCAMHSNAANAIAETLAASLTTKGEQHLLAALVVESATPSRRVNAIVETLAALPTKLVMYPVDRMLPVQVVLAELASISNEVNAPVVSHAALPTCWIRPLVHKAPGRCCSKEIFSLFTTADW